MVDTPLKHALSQAPDRPVATTAQPDEEYFLFRIGELTLAVRSNQVRQVTRLGALTPLPRAPTFILGVTALRGEVVPVIDLLRFLSQGESIVTPRSRLFVGDSGGFVVGFMSDSVIGLRRIFVADKLPPPLSGGVSSEYLVGVVRMTDIGTVNLLDLARAVSAARQKVVSR